MSDLREAMRWGLLFAALLWLLVVVGPVWLANILDSWR